jgi:hypothetical protein
MLADLSVDQSFPRLKELGKREILMLPQQHRLDILVIMEI